MISSVDTNKHPELEYLQIITGKTCNSSIFYHSPFKMQPDSKEILFLGKQWMALSQVDLATLGWSFCFICCSSTYRTDRRLLFLKLLMLLFVAMSVDHHVSLQEKEERTCGISTIQEGKVERDYNNRSSSLNL